MIFRRQPSLVGELQFQQAPPGALQPPYLALALSAREAFMIDDKQQS
jgi:hypothetical protein